MLLHFFLFKQKTAYEVRISDWSSDVCSSVLIEFARADIGQCVALRLAPILYQVLPACADVQPVGGRRVPVQPGGDAPAGRIFLLILEIFAEIPLRPGGQFQRAALAQQVDIGAELEPEIVLPAKGRGLAGIGRASGKE